MGTTYSGVGKGSWEQGSSVSPSLPSSPSHTTYTGVYDYKSLPLPSSTTHSDPTLVASWTHDSQTGEFISYDTPADALAKADYINREGLGGAMYWELSSVVLSSVRFVH